MARLEAGGVGATLMTLQKVAAALDHTATVELSGCELRSSRQIFSGFATKVKQVGAWRLSSGVRSSREACMQAGDSFEEFVVAVSPRLQRAFVARYGVDLGDEALADALSLNPPSDLLGDRWWSVFAMRCRAVGSVRVGAS